AIRQLHMFPILDASSLSPEGGWSANEVVQVIPAELPTEDLMRIWDALDPPYRLSVSYIARLVRLDPDQQAVGRPVVATRLAYGEEARPGARCASSSGANAVCSARSAASTRQRWHPSTIRCRYRPLAQDSSAIRAACTSSPAGHVSTRTRPRSTPRR